MGVMEGRKGVLRGMVIGVSVCRWRARDWCRGCWGVTDYVRKCWRGVWVERSVF